MSSKDHSEKAHRGVFNENKKEMVRGLIWIGVIVIVMFAGMRFIGLDTIQDTVRRVGIWGPIIFILAKASTIIFAPLGGTPLYFVAGPLFGFWNGFFYIFLGDLFGSVVAFWISRIFGRKVVRFFLSEHGMKYVDEILHHISTWKGFVVTRIIFMGMHDIVSYVAGLTKMSFLQYALTSMFVAVIPMMLVVAAGMALIDSATLTVAVIVAVSVVSFGLTVWGIQWLRNKS